jgi:hypothetical protein
MDNKKEAGIFTYDVPTMLWMVSEDMSSRQQGAFYHKTRAWYRVSTIAPQGQFHQGIIDRLWR